MESKSDDLKLTKTIILHCTELHPSRVGNYLEDLFNCKITKIFEDLVFLETTDPSTEKLLPILHNDGFLLRFVHMFFLCTDIHQGPAEDLSFLKNLDFKDKAVRCSIYPRGIKQTVVDYLCDDENGPKANLKPTNYTHFLSLIFAGDSYYYALTQGKYFYDQAKIKQPDLISRAVFKIKESIDRFHFKFEKNWKVMDVGASPGGITAFLAEEKCPEGTVVAIDPSDLTLKIPKNVVFLKGLAQDVIGKAEKHGPYDFMIVDINDIPWVVISIIKFIIPLLKVGGTFFWTIKLPSMNGDGEPAKDYIKKISANFLEVFTEMSPNFRVKWLLSNKNERTFVTTKLSESPIRELAPPLEQQYGANTWVPYKRRKKEEDDKKEKK